MKTAVVMAGGEGLRLRPITERMPKPLVPIDHRPIMEFVVAALRSSGVQRILVVLQSRPEQIMAHFGDGSAFGVPMDYVLQYGELGTAGSVRQAVSLLDDDDFVVTASDLLFRGDLAAGEELHHARESLATLALTQVDDPSPFGVVTRAAGGRVTDFREKPRPGKAGGRAVSAGIYFLNRRALDPVPPGRACDFGRDLFPALVRDGAPVYGWDLPGYWRDVGTPDALASARREIGELPELRNIVTRWPSSRGLRGGRIWVHLEEPRLGWTEMNPADRDLNPALVNRLLRPHT